MKSSGWMRVAAALVVAAIIPTLVAGQEKSGEALPAQGTNLPVSRAAAAESILYDLSNTISFSALAWSNPLGVEVADVGAALRAQLDLPEATGVVVNSVNADSELGKAGLQVHDVVLKIGEQAVTGPQSFSELITAQAGKPLMLHLLRKGKPASVSATVSQAPVYEVANSPLAFTTLLIANSAQGPQFRIGVTLSPADDVLRSQLKLADGEGLVVTEIVADSPAAKAGIQKHDVLTKLDGKRLTTVEAINAQIQEIKNRQITISYFRGGAEHSSDVTPQESTAGLAVWQPQVSTSYVLLSGALNRPAGEYLITAQPNVFENRHLLNWVYNGAAAPTEKPPIAEQLAALKKQLADLQKSLEALEASLPAPAAEQKAAPKE